LELRRLFASNGDEELAQTVTTAMQVALNRIGLPGSPRDFHQYLAENYEDYEQQRIGAHYDHLAPRSQIRAALQRGLAGNSHQKLAQFSDRFDSLCGYADEEAPGRVLFDRCMQDLANE